MYVMIRTEIGMEELEIRKKQGAVGWEPYGIRMFVLYGWESSHHTWMNPFLYKTRHLVVSNHINYEVIGLV